MKRQYLSGPPEPDTYPDEGCRYASSCLSCPFERCLWELPLPERRAVLAGPRPPRALPPRPSRRLIPDYSSGYLSQCEVLILRVLLDLDHPIQEPELSERAFGFRDIPSRVHVYKLRRKLVPYGLDRFISSGRGIGYHWAVPT